MAKRFILSLLVVLCASSGFAEVFAYKQAAGDKWRISATVEEDVFVNGELSHHSVIVERTTGEVAGRAGANEALIKAVFQSAERAVAPDGTERFDWGEDYEAAFTRTGQGQIRIQSNYFRPAVRNVPTFPAGDVVSGQTWQAPGVEVHDFRESLGISAPYTIPFTAYYKYLGSREWKGKSYPAFSVNWDIEYLPPRSANGNPPEIVRGSTKQTVYWDSGAGREAGAEEEFTLELIFYDDTSFLFRAKGEAQVYEAQTLDKLETSQEVAREIERLGIPDVSVQESPEGVTLSLDDIQFEPDSDRLLASEKVKLDKLAAILAQFPDRDLLISGHTALAGSKSARDKLSLDRAEAVASYLRTKGVRSAAGIVTRGYGADRPVAPNTTEEGRRKNRRVEITILEN